MPLPRSPRFGSVPGAPQLQLLPLLFPRLKENAAFCFLLSHSWGRILESPRTSTDTAWILFFFFFLDEAFSVTKTFSLLPLDIPFSLLNTSVLNYFSSFPSPSSLQLLYYLSSVALEGFIH